MLILPTEPIKAKIQNPRFLILFGLPKTGKTTLAAKLDNNLIIDLEGGSQFMDAVAVQARTAEHLKEIANAIYLKNKEAGHNVYKRITIDNSTALEEICMDYAIELYRRTPQGKNYKGTDIRTMEHGGGWPWIRTAVKEMLHTFQGLCDEFILIGHTKDININEDGEEVTKMDLDLVGKLARIVEGEADAVGYVYRKNNKTIVSFKGGGLISQARASHLAGKEITLAESQINENGDVQITTYWDKIFKPNLN
jgi:hypothetical protein